MTVETGPLKTSGQQQNDDDDDQKNADAAPTLRPASSIIRAGGGAQSGLWGQGISGELPIVLLRIADIENLDVARELLKAHEYWRMKRPAVDLVILNERQASYVQDLQAALETLARVNRPPVGPGQDGTAGRCGPPPPRRCAAHGIAAELLQFVPLEGSIKISRLSLRDQTDGARRLSVTAYVEWVLGPLRSASLGFVATDLDAVTGAVFARNPWGAAFGARVAFLDMAGAQSDWTGDRGEFLGRNGSPADPQALTSGGSLSKRGGAGLDPCGVLQTKIELPPGGATEIVVFLGHAPDAAAVALIERFRAATLYEHCARALDQSLALGGHGLPLIGAGDWNDGMNRVGAKGAGESVWLGWFLYTTLAQSALLAEARGETARAAAWRAHAAGLQASLEREAWDGEWYRRGFYDDGAPLGSVMSKSCRIDSIAQSWAVLSGAAAPERAARAMAAVERELIRPDDRLALLFTPPFDPSSRDTGYVQGYPPGVRENGGQYTHAALWSVMAFAAQGDGDKATRLFSLLNPINHARTRADALRYRVEPSAVAADVSAAPPHVGRGGWTWYTGSAGWMQRAGIESILGLRLSGGFLLLEPCIPRAWPGFHIALRHGSARYEIAVDNVGATGKGVAFAAVDGVDGVEITGRPLRLALADDDLAHKIEVRLG